MADSTVETTSGAGSAGVTGRAGATGTVVRGGAAAGYRPSATMPFVAEFRRQASRRRTQLALGFMVLLPLIILVAFQFGSGDDDRDGQGEFSSLADLATSGGLNFTLFSILVSASFLLVVVVALFCGDTVASEASWGSLRYLLAVPVPRARLLTVKLLVALAYSVLALLLLAGTALLAGTLRYGWAPLSSQVAAELTPGEGVLRLLAVLGYLAVVLLVVAGLAFLLSVITDAALGAVGGAVLLWILSSILDQITALGALRSFLPTHYSTAWLGLLSTPMQTDDVVRGAISAVSYATVFWALAFWRFTRKDITS
ncbi:ABC transporter permease [Micromonospora sp. KC606]|uniref:ABC transporter permease n=1 Tax=Micromonospora sp. KC606 TaxID=2530379 RepID=UPI0010530D3D|nr:ABC transporter permease [Micromonospora sp. KC606]TDC76799.1 ABC transporter permease [Micromonospora sp. KC606]